MKLKEIKGEYDVVIGLGSMCQTAAQMRRHRLRTFSAPADWFTWGWIPNLLRAIENDWQDFMLGENLDVREEHEGKLLVMDTLYNCLSVHDFEVKENTPEDLHALPKVREKILRRASRMKRKMKEKDNILFIRVGGDRHEAEELEKFLSKYVKKSFKVLIVNHIDVVEIREVEYGLPNTCTVEIFHPQDTWSGHDASWDILLDGITTRDNADEGVYVPKTDECDRHALMEVD